MTMKNYPSHGVLLRAHTATVYALLKLLILSFAAIGSIMSLLPEIAQPVSSARQESAPLPSDNDSHLPARITSTDGLWRQMDAPSVETQGEDLKAHKSFSRFRLNLAAQAELLSHAPLEFTPAAKHFEAIITLPMPDGTFSRFRVDESPVMDHSLAARFPQIKTYRGKGLDDPTAIARLDSTPAGFHAIVLSERGTFLIGPESRTDPNVYLSYEQNSAQGEDGSFTCSVPETDETATTAATADNQLRLSKPTSATDSIGGTLRTYRLAVAATAEYTQTYGGGTVEGVLAAITTTINMVNAVYERDLAIRLILIPNETDIIFTDAATDGYSSDAIDTMYNQNQSILDARIGANNYEIGHVFDGHTTVSAGRFFFQGRANLASVSVNGRKANGVSIFRSLEPSATNAVFVVAHEMGHQFGASHSFNGTTTSDCLNGRAASTAFEPGTGSTIMAYRGSSGTNYGYFNLCGAEDLHSTDLYFHIASVSQITNYTTNGNGANGAVLIATGNLAPSVDAGADYTVPRSTPFTLTATGSDPEGDFLTYCWEEMDLGAPSPPSTDDGSRPIFRSFAPTASPARTFPQLSDILSGTSTLGESLPTTTRTMNFRVTLRDNHAGGGGGATDAMLLSVDSSSGPFRVTAPASSANWPAGSTQSVTWDVANTSSAPVGCAAVRILLSVDGGLSFPIVLAASTPNDGEASITVPNSQTSTARVKVEAVGNIFFDISDVAFSIAAAPEPSPTPTPVNPGGAVVLSLSSTSYAVNEGEPSGIARIMVERGGDNAVAASVDYVTSDVSGMTPCQTNVVASASERCDYATTAGTLRFAAGESAKEIRIPIINDLYVEPNETFTIALRDARGASIGTSTATVTITDDDTKPATTNPIDEQPFFIRQQYIDFLGRPPEEAGFDFWMSRMTNCPASQICDRTDTSQRFFQSDEFQERGFYVFRLYDAVLGRLPLYVEFVPETARLSGFQTVQEQRQGKDAYLADFMQKTEFRKLYSSCVYADGTLITGQAAAFVDALSGKAGITPASRQTLINNLQSGAKDIAHTLEDFIQTPEMSNVGTLYYDRGFITMQYFGYLRRDPETAGFNFWQSQLIGANAPHKQDYRFMVGGFLQSDEYCFRFASISTTP